MLSVQVHPAEDGFPVQGPPPSGQGLGPVNAVFAHIEGTGAPGKGAHVVLGAVRVQTDHSRRRRLSFLDDVILSVHPGAAGVIRGEGRFSGDLFHRHEGPAGLGLFGPDVVESFLNGPEGLFEGLAGLFPDIALERCDGEGMTRDPVEVIGREGGLVIEIPHARDGHVAGRVVVRGGLLEGAVHPLVPVAPVAVVKGDMVIIQEIPVPAASGARQGCFGDDGIPFQEGLRGEQGGNGARPHFAHQVVDPAEGPAVGELHLRDMAGFMDRELGHPGQGHGPVGLRMGVQVHALGSPGHRAVGVGIEGMEDDRKPAPLETDGIHSGAHAHGGLPFFEVQGIGPGQGIHLFGIYEAVVRRAEGGPAAERVGPVLVELGPGGEAGKEAGKEYEDAGVAESRHGTKLIIFI